MASEDPPRATEPATRDRRVYPLVALSVATGVFFFVQYEIDYTPPKGPAVLVLVGLTLGVPLVMGYTDCSFLESTATGLLPWLGVQVGSWSNPPIEAIDVQNMSNALVISAGMALPVVAVASVVGVGLRERDTLSDRERELAVRLAATVLIAVAVLAATHAGVLSAGIDQ